MEYNKKGPFIHLFQTPLGYYFYDVNTNQIIKINNDIYTILQNYTEECKNNEQILKLYEAGLLKTNRVQKIKHPYTELLPYALKRKVHILILQITQNCNLRCEYCLYSGGYKTRKHQNKRMNWITAKEAIDFLKAHSNEKKKVYIAFYGGEPLLEFELIRKCVHYAQSIMPGKEIEYSMTTNGTLLNKEVIEYLVKNNFKITVSIDGPKEVHDRSRHFADTDKGSFDVILENLRYFREKHLKFYEKNVGFNSVVSTEYNFSCSDDFFKEEELFKDSEYYFNERQNIKSEIERSGGIKVYLNIVPKYLDIAVSEEENEVDFLTLSSDFVKNKIDMYHAEDVYCVNDFTSLNDLIIELIEELASYVEDVKCEDLKTFNMDIKDVEKCISDIFEKIGLTKDLIQKAKQESIFGNKIRMRARELLIVFFEIERVFNIYFTEEEINDFSFASINSIIECVKKHLKNKSDVINK